MPHYQTTVTYLAANAPFRPHGMAAPFPNDLRFAVQNNMPLHEYRALYDAVGRNWHWVNRRYLTDNQLAAIIHHRDTNIFVLRQANSTALGFVETSARKFPEIEILFVGLIQAAIGQGLGKRMLAHVLDNIIERDASRISIQTCTLHHPAALRLYQRAGFAPTHRKEVTIIDREAYKTIDREAYNT